MEVMLFSLKQILVREVHLRPRVRSTVPRGTGLAASSTGYTSRISCVRNNNGDCVKAVIATLVHRDCGVEF